jgi:hypothetical protein
MEGRHQGVVCGQVLANNNFNTRELHSHLTTKYGPLVNNPMQPFKKTLSYV